MHACVCVPVQSSVPGQALWAGVSGDNQYWRASMWQLDSPAGTFAAVKGEAAPNAQLLWRPMPEW